MSQWKVMTRALHRCGGGPIQFAKFNAAGASYSDLNRARDLGLIVPAGRHLWKLTPLGEEWCEGRAAETLVRIGERGRPNTAVVSTVTAPLPVGVRSTRHRLDVADGEPRFTPREKEVLVLMSKGCSNTEIGRLLGLSAHTISDYVKGVFGKLDVNTRVEAAVWACKAGML